MANADRVVNEFCSYVSSNSLEELTQGSLRMEFHSFMMKATYANISASKFNTLFDMVLDKLNLR